MNLGKYSKYYEALYTDKMDIYSYKEITDPVSKTTNNELSETPDMEDIPCRLSYKSMDSGIITNGTHNNSSISAKIFAPLSILLNDGDYIKIKRTDANNIYYPVYEGTIGKPITYPTHQEALFDKEDNA